MLVVVGVLGFVIFGGGGTHVLGVGSDDAIPPFDFVRGHTSAVSVATNDKKVPAAAQTAAKNVTTTLDTLYTEAFLDPGNWRDGSYDEVWPLFSDQASSAAQQDASTLTVGSGGGDTYTEIFQPKGRIDVRVLMNDKSQVQTAVAVVRFSAVGTRKDGKETLFRSSGQYFLNLGADSWQVYSFSVDRDDHVREPAPTASGSPTEQAS